MKKTHAVISALVVMSLTAPSYALDLEKEKAEIYASVIKQVSDPGLARDITEIRFAREILSQLPQEEKDQYLSRQQSYLSNVVESSSAKGEPERSERLAAIDHSRHEYEVESGRHEEMLEGEEEGKNNVFFFGAKRIYAPGADSSLTGTEIGFEHVLIKDYLEVQYGLSKNNDPDNPIIGLDITFKIPFEINESTELKLGYGTTHSYQKALDFGNHSVSAEIQHWFSPDYGVYVGITRGLTIDKSSEIATGLLMTIDHK
jgi:hypothetical protein